MVTRNFKQSKAYCQHWIMVRASVPQNPRSNKDQRCLLLT